MSDTKKDPEAFRMTFTAHLEELRRRLIICVTALAVGMGISYAFRDQLFAFILHPLFVARETASDGDELADDMDDSPTKTADLAREAQALSRRALASKDAHESARLAARAAGLAGKAVEAADRDLRRRDAIQTLRRQRSIAYTNPINPFWVSLELSLVGGICLSFGLILWEIWAFVAPGLYPTERRYAAPFIIAASACFLGGAGFGYRFVFPIGFGYLTRFSREISEAQGIDMMDLTTVDSFVDVALKLLLAFGLVFELPVVVSFLALMGVVDHRQLWRFGRWFIVIAVTIAAILTPPDAFSQIMMAIPMCVLYFLSIGIAYFLHPDRRRKKTKTTTDEPPTDAREQG